MARQRAPHIAAGPGIETLRRMTQYFNQQKEDFNYDHTLAELVKIWTFVASEQGGRVHEMADSWPPFLLRAVLNAKLGAKIDEEIVERAGGLA